MRKSGLCCRNKEWKGLTRYKVSGDVRGGYGQVLWYFKLKQGTGVLTGAWKYCDFLSFLVIMTDWPTDQRTWGVIGKLHFQLWCHRRDQWLGYRVYTYFRLALMRLFKAVWYKRFDFSGVGRKRRSGTGWWGRGKRSIMVWKCDL